MLDWPRIFEQISAQQSRIKGEFSFSSLSKHKSCFLLQLDAPIFVTWFQAACTVVLCFLCSAISQRFPNYIKFPRMTFDKKVSRDVLPLSIIFVAMITLNNLCLKYVGVSFYYVGRSLTTVFNVVCTYLILGQHTSARALVCCMVIIGGFFMGVS